MRNKYFSKEDTLFEITERYPVLISVLVNNGFSRLGNQEKRKNFGSRLTLEQAAGLKGLNLEKLAELMVDQIESGQGNMDVTLKDRTEKGDIKVEGLLPCPVRVPLMEELDKLTAKMDSSVEFNLKAASQGLDWLKESISDGIKPDELADIFISAGFDLFFDRNLMDRFRRQGVFKDSTGIEDINQVFKDNDIDLIDPEGDYSVLGIVPAVFMVNRDELDGRKTPATWEDILSEEFSGSISLPVSDFDLFNAILINIYRNYGHDGVRKLGRSLMKSLHPSQMVKDGGSKKAGQPVVTIMPYFFTRMAGRFPHMEFIWPEDGAIISPIFMLTKEAGLPEIQPLIDFFSSELVGEILAKQGLFPSILPEVENSLPADADFMWPGWDFLRKEDPGKLLRQLEEEFNQAAVGVSL